MKSNICESNISQESREIMKTIGNIARSINEKCFAVGGIVRDCILGRENDDLDIVCTDITKVANELERRSIAKNITSEKGITKQNFFTNIMIFNNGKKVDLVEPRKETYVKESIKPIVEKGTLEDDVMRRDFTINTLHLGISDNDWMYIYDHTSKGISDINKKIIRTPRDPKITFDEDPSRILRAVRFAACYNFTIDPNVKQAIKNMTKEISRVSSELINKEIMKGAKCDNYFRLMYETDLMNEIMPEITKLKNVKQNPQHHKFDALEHTFGVVDNLPHDSLLRMVGILHDAGKAITTKEDGSSYDHEKYSKEIAENILNRLKFSNNDKNFILTLVENHMRLHNFPENATEKATRKFINETKKYYENLKIISEADIRSDSPNVDEKIKIMNKKIENIEAVKKNMESIFGPSFKLSINGNDIRKYGWEKQNIGIIKTHIEKKVIDGELKNDREELLQYLKTLKMNEVNE